MTAERRPWIKGGDGLFHPTPPYREGEVVGCEGCGRPVKVSKYVELHQFAYDDCRPCGEEADNAFMASVEGE